MCSAERTNQGAQLEQVGNGLSSETVARDSLTKTRPLSTDPQAVKNKPRQPLGKVHARPREKQLQNTEAGVCLGRVRNSEKASMATAE